MKNRLALKGSKKGSGSARQGIDLNVINRAVHLQAAAACEDGGMDTLRACEGEKEGASEGM